MAFNKPVVFICSLTSVQEKPFKQTAFHQIELLMWMLDVTSASTVSQKVQKLWLKVKEKQVARVSSSKNLFSYHCRQSFHANLMKGTKTQLITYSRAYIKLGSHNF